MQKTSLFFLLFSLSTFFADDLVCLKETSFLLSKQDVLQGVKPQTKAFGKSDPDQALQKASVWMQLPSCFLSRDLKSFKQLGIDGFIRDDQKIKDKNTVFIDQIDLYNGVESDFQLALKNYQDFAHLFFLTEIDIKDWSKLPSCSPYKLSTSQVVELKNDYYLFNLSQDIAFSCTPPIKGEDNKIRRWVYPHYLDQCIAILNFFDPTFLAFKLASLKILETKKTNEIIGLPSVKKGFSLYETENLALLTRKYGGFSCQFIDLPLEEIFPYTHAGSDLFYHPLQWALFLHAFMREDTSLLKDYFCKLLCLGIEPKRFVHKYEYPYVFEGKFLQDLKLQSTLIEDINFLFEKQSPYLKMNKKTIFSSNVGLSYTKTGDKSPFCSKDQVLKAHKLLSSYFALQPGVFYLTYKDLRGGYFDYKTKKQEYLYPPIDDQLYDNLSFAKTLQKILKIRSLYQLDKAKLVEVLDTKDSGTIALLLEVESKDLVIVATNFKDEKIEEKVSSNHLRDRYALDLISNTSYPKEYKTKIIDLTLNNLSNICLCLKKKPD